MHKWKIGKPVKAVSDELMLKGGLSKLCADVLSARGIGGYDEAAAFFSNSEPSDPFTAQDMDKAAQLISEAVDSMTNICIYGDYDCDGITATAALYSYLECLGANVSFFINERAEGYGLNSDNIRKLHERGTELIITVDNGISAISEADLIYELGMRLIVTDHHQPSETLPRAEAVVDLHRTDDLSRFKDLCGCGLVLKLIAAMEDGDHTAAMEQFSDLAAIATVADVVPLRGENRYIVSTGLHYLENTANIGLKALIEASGMKPPYTSTGLAFTLAPRINAAGRFGSATDAVRLLLTEDEEEAKLLADILCGYNKTRQETEKGIMSEISAAVKADPFIADRRVSVFYGKGWHHGVIGIAAARVMERTGKPTFIISEENGEARGSARAPEGFHVFEALSYCSSVLTKFGGHSGAGGFSLLPEKVGEFTELLQKFAAEGCGDINSVSQADKALMPDDLSVEEVGSLSVLEPFGAGNPRPMFLMHGAKINAVQALSEGKHTKLSLDYGGVTVSGLMFGQPTDKFGYAAGDMMDMLVYPELNTYNGRTSVNVRINECRKCGVSQQKYFAAKDAYEALRRGEAVSPALMARIAPERPELVKVYKAVKKEFLPFDNIFSAVSDDSMNFCKFMVCIDIFEEKGLIETDRFYMTARLVEGAARVDIETSEILKALRAGKSDIYLAVRKK